VLQHCWLGDRNVICLQQNLLQFPNEADLTWNNCRKKTLVTKVEKNMLAHCQQ